MNARAASAACVAVVVVVAVVAAGVAFAGVSGADVLTARAQAVRASRSLAPMDASATAASTHDPFASEDCGACHASADKKNPGAVADKSSELCLKCHDDPGVDGKTPFAHLHGGPAGSCVDCHNPHNSAEEHLLHAPPTALCGGCHVDKVPAAGARVVHAPIEKPASCVQCHQPHGSNTPHLLSAAFPITFYAPYARDTYALCFTCHAAKLVEDKRTTSATRFRNGDQNLHTVHVMRDDGKGRSCAACHDLHVGARATLVHDDVAFGSHGWRLPIGFAPTETGGSCAKTCHVERSYDRRFRDPAKARP
jgi:predicted CXXCH cytochrome family protein